MLGRVNTYPLCFHNACEYFLAGEHANLKQGNFVSPKNNFMMIWLLKVRQRIIKSKQFEIIHRLLDPIIECEDYIYKSEFEETPNLVTLLWRC